MQLTDTTEMPSTSACPVAGSSGYVARPSMSDIGSPESETASFTAVSAWAASGMSAERVTLEYPTPLTAILHRLSHMRSLLLFGARETKLRQRDVVVQLLEDDLDAAADLRLGIRCFQQVAGEQRAGCIVEFHDDAGVGHHGCEAFVAGVVHDCVGVDRSGAAHGFELQVRSDALNAGRIRRVLEMTATLAALQFKGAAFGCIPKWFCPFVWNGDRPGHLAPVAHSVRLVPAVRSAT